MMTPIPIPTPPMMCSFWLNISSMAVGQLWNTNTNVYWSSLMMMMMSRPCESGLETPSGCRGYLGDEDLQPLLLGANVFGGIDDRPRGAATVQLTGRERERELETSTPQRVSKRANTRVRRRSYSKVDESQRLLQRLLTRLFVVGVSLFVKLSHVLHHLETQQTLTPTPTPTPRRGNKRVCEPWSFTRSLLESPQIPAATSTAKMRSRKKKNWTKPQKKKSQVKTKQKSLYFEFNGKNTQSLTNPSMHGDSLMAPQHPRKPTTIIKAPAAIRM